MKNSEVEIIAQSASETLILLRYIVLPEEDYPRFLREFLRGIIKRDFVPESYPAIILEVCELKTRCEKYSAILDSEKEAQ